MTLKHLLPLLAVTITIQSSGTAPTVLTVPNDSFWGVSLDTLNCMDSPAVDCGTPTVKVPQVSTGPVIIKASGSPDCYSIAAVNPNGSLVKPPAWTPCP